VSGSKNGKKSNNGKCSGYYCIFCPCVGAASESSRNLWILGYPERALRRVRQAYGMADSQSNPGARGALVFAAFIHQLRREVAACQEKAEAAITLSREKDISDNILWASFLRGWAIASQARQ
jgi:adenylate cyclase